ncbi:MAG: 16S rRNA (cytosine(1402)-N(4))-methyltransferase RsmH [Candidatus Peregrinibacteria bacterium]
MEHVPVLKDVVQKYLDVRRGEVVLDATLGLGGHSLEILKSLGKKGKLIAFEQDERNLQEAKKRLKAFEKQIIYIHDNFRYLKNRITGEGIKSVDKIFFDLGLSSPHVDDPERGFSFMKEGPLDMRFDRRSDLTASDVVNTYSEEELARIFYDYGEERFAKKIVRGICGRRKEKAFETTTDLAGFIESIIPKRGHKLHPATKIFQALRIEVNDEINALKKALEQAASVLKTGGRIVVISYHSLEDRVVKQFFKKLISPPATQSEAIYRNFGEPFFEAITKKPVVPTEEEIMKNPRSRSAKLRAYTKLKDVD